MLFLDNSVETALANEIAVDLGFVDSNQENDGGITVGDDDGKLVCNLGI